MNAKCNVEGCDGPIHQNDMCAKHYGRWYRHGHTGLAQESWGSKSKHPLYANWNVQRHRQTISGEWFDNFWAFVADVGDKPSDKHMLRRLDPTNLLGPDNFYWHEKLLMKEPGETKYEYARRHTRHRIKLYPEKFKGYHLKERFNITIGDLERMLVEQNNACAICKKPETLKDRSLCVDHNHKTGKVRGLLCGACNKALGLFQDDSALMRKAADYLIHYREINHGRTCDGEREGCEDDDGFGPDHQAEKEEIPDGRSVGDVQSAHVERHGRGEEETQKDDVLT